MVWYAVDAAKGISDFDIKLINAILRVQSPVCIILTKADLVDGKKLKEDIEGIKQRFMFLEVFAASAKEDSAIQKEFSLQDLIRTSRALFPEVEKSKDKLKNSMGENDDKINWAAAAVGVGLGAIIAITLYRYIGGKSKKEESRNKRSKINWAAAAVGVGLGAIAARIASILYRYIGGKSKKEYR
jgi:hypothetical protein